MNGCAPSCKRVREECQECDSDAADSDSIPPLPNSLVNAAMQLMRLGAEGPIDYNKVTMAQGIVEQFWDEWWSRNNDGDQ